MLKTSFLPTPFDTNLEPSFVINSRTCPIAQTKSHFLSSTQIPLKRICHGKNINPPHISWKYRNYWREIWSCQLWLSCFSSPKIWIQDARKRLTSWWPLYIKMDIFNGYSLCYEGKSNGESLCNAAHTNWGYCELFVRLIYEIRRMCLTDYITDIISILMMILLETPSARVCLLNVEHWTTL